ncbi:hypothetical protein MMC14_007127 [Varicellaria rhodocarpa]|nr:hypothetical protein [Varicellaria rhodocarpa]
MFDICNIVERQHFTVFHEIVLGLRQSSFRDELEGLPHNMINQVDRTGKTPLAWAARRGEFQKVEQLLECGANPRIVDNNGRSPLHYSILVNDSRALSALLRAGSNVRQKTYYSEYTPLRTAIWWCDNTSFIEQLLKFGSNINAQECDGMAALQEATYHGRTQVCTFLLECQGIEKDARSQSGLTALMISIEQRKHGCLRALLAHEANYLLKDKNSCNILHLAAKSRDIRTVRILQQYALRRLDIADRDLDGKTALALAEEHRDVDPQWFTAFRELLENLVATTVVGYLFRGGKACHVEEMEEREVTEIWEDAREVMVM